MRAPATTRTQALSDGVFASANSGLAALETNAQFKLSDGLEPSILS
jgi:hypothetical protein